MIRRLCSTIALVLLLFIASTQTSLAAAGKEYSADLFNATINVQNNGDLLITEAVTFRFVGGPFSFVYREIPTDHTDNISIVSASIDGHAMGQGTTAGNYEVGSGNPLKVTWHLQPQSDTVHTFQLTYQVQGAIQQTRQADLLDWNALPTNYAYNIKKASVTVNYPARTHLINAPSVVQGPATITQPLTAGSVTYNASDLTDNTPIEVGMQFQAGSLIQAEPQWQRNQQEVSTFLGPGLLGAFGIAILSILGAIFYQRKRQPPVVTSAIQPGSITTPPADLSPAVAGALVTSPIRGNGSFNQALGTLLDLANRGVVTIVGNESTTTQAARTPADFSVQLQSVPEQLTPYENLLITNLFGGPAEGTQPVPFSEVYTSVQARLKALDVPIREEFQQRGLVESTYAPAHKNLGRLSLLFFIISLVGTLATLIVAANLYAWPLGLIPLGFLPASFILLIMRGSLRYFSPQGIQLIKQCQAFDKYLHALLHDNRMRSSDMEQKQDIFMRYLPYATSFGWGNQWIQNFEQLGGTALPPWFLAFGQHSPNEPDYSNAANYNYNHNLATMMIITNSHSYQPINYGGGSSGNFSGASFGGGSFGGGAGAGGGGGSGAG
ncbi:DUF2207 domain-containing protein [Dictyobacter kobayashii]|uniref:DUF2207 domain-containing protein n=1 Tax=Dictyobacter kobayashii TaxID=2014872 RepID=A0A402AFH6_9CHLR|nr:DUF2207 domain-containing protein [Dictyobacter kobayashii]GCE17823.1 hypothetical protein KDK_16230 [Dictyobacter kobayashii]